MPNFVMTARLIEGQFPNYEAVIPKGHPGKLVISRTALAGALRRVAVMAEERNKPVKFVLAPAALKLSASSADLGEAEETLDVDYGGAEVTIGFNSKYVLDGDFADRAGANRARIQDGLTRRDSERGGRWILLCDHADAYLAGNFGEFRTEFSTGNGTLEGCKLAAWFCVIFAIIRPFPIDRRAG